jgi:type I restriction enzyme M protein
VHKQILKLIDNFRGPLDLSEYIVQIAACFLWIKQTESKSIDDEIQFDRTSTDFHLLQQKLVCAVQMENVFMPSRGQLTGENTFQLMISLQELIRAKVVTYKDLSDTIKLMSSEGGKYSGEAYIPEELSKLSVSLLGNNNHLVYCPFGRGYYFAHELPKTSEAFGESLVLEDVFFARVHSFLLDREFTIHPVDPIGYPSFVGDGGLKQFDSAIAFPPLNLKYGKHDINDIWDRFPEKSLMGDVYHLRHMLSQSTDIVVCVVSSGFLFRTAAGEKQFKQDILEHNWLKAVIALPSNLLSSTSIPINIIVLDKNKTNDTVNFIDASNDTFVEQETRTRNKLINIEQIIELYQSTTNGKISKHCSNAEIAENDFNLSPSRYVLTEEEEELVNFLESYETKKLEDLVEIIRPQALKHNEQANTVFTEYNLASMNAIGEITGEGKQISISPTDLNRANKQMIKANDILVVCKGAVGKIAIIDEHINENSIASQAFSILRIKPHINSVTTEALYQYLISDFGQLQFKTIITGTSALMISAKDLNTLQIPLFNTEKLNEIKEVRQQVVDTHKQIEALNNKITSLNNSWL